MACMRLIVANMKLEIVHCFQTQNRPLKETSAGGVCSLFNTLMTSYLAVFQTIIGKLLDKPNCRQIY